MRKLNMDDTPSANWNVLEYDTRVIHTYMAE